MPPAKKAATAAKKAAASSKAVPAKAAHRKPSRSSISLPSWPTAMTSRRKQAEAVLVNLVTPATKHLKKGGIRFAMLAARRQTAVPATGTAQLTAVTVSVSR
jgi:hypothetical protein